MCIYSYTAIYRLIRFKRTHLIALELVEVVALVHLTLSGVAAVAVDSDENVRVAAGARLVARIELHLVLFHCAHR